VSSGSRRDTLVTVTLRFSKSHSKYYKNALALAESFSGFRRNGDIHIVEIKMQELLYRNRHFMELYRLVQNWKHAEFLAGETIVEKHSVHSVLHDLTSSFRRCASSRDLKNCAEEFLDCCTFIDRVNTRSILFENVLSKSKEAELAQVRSRLSALSKRLSFVEWSEVYHILLYNHNPVCKTALDGMVSLAKSSAEWLTVYFTDYWQDDDEPGIEQKALDAIENTTDTHDQWLDIFKQSIPGSSLEALALRELNVASHNADVKIESLPTKYRKYRLSKDDLPCRPEAVEDVIPEFGKIPDHVWREMGIEPP
jgi:hypothetical protein